MIPDPLVNGDATELGMNYKGVQVNLVWSNIFVPARYHLW